MRYSYTNLPDLSRLRADLAIEPVNTGRVIRPMGPSGIVTDDIEGLHARADKYGKVRFASGVEFPPYAYRGQTEEHLPCVPGLGRKNHPLPEDKLLALCRSVAFEDAVAAHPLVAMAEQTAFAGLPLHIDKEGLAQHYGMMSDMVDLTTSFDVASFFAACRWVEQNGRGRYLPMGPSVKPGVIYRLIFAFAMNHPDCGEDAFSTIGWQPLPRPAQQRAFAIRLKPNQDFRSLHGVGWHYFRQSAKVSHRIWKAFREGESLFPNDAVMELSHRAKALQEFTRCQIDRAWMRLESWLGKAFSDGERSAMEASIGVRAVAAEMLTWDGLDVERDEDRLRAKLVAEIGEARFRMVAYH